jgi:DNA-binding NarL/FixJ family response regulator
VRHHGKRQSVHRANTNSDFGTAAVVFGTLDRIVKGASVIDPALVQELVAARRVDDPLEDLSPRESEVLELMAEGRSNRGIAEALVVTPHAVEKHVTSLFSKLGVSGAAEDHRRVLAVLRFLRA